MEEQRLIAKKAITFERALNFTKLFASLLYSLLEVIKLVVRALVEVIN